MAFCDGCDRCWHQRCISLVSIPLGDWFCPDCAPFFPETRRLDIPRPTFDVARPPRLEKKRRRLEAGLGTEGLPTIEEVEKLKEAADAPSTARKKLSLAARFAQFCEQVNIDPSTTSAFELYVTWRVKQGLKDSTILGEISILRHLNLATPPADQELTRLTRAVRRLADCGGEAKDPLTGPELARLKESLVGAGWTNDGSHNSIRRLRNWSFILLGFIGLFRASELVSLDWTHLRLGWRLEGSSTTTDLPLDERPPRAQLQHLTVHVLESKTDPGARGQLVRIGVDPAAFGGLGCPIWSLLSLRRWSRLGQAAVFAEPNLNLTPDRVSYDTMLRSFKEALADAGTSPQRIAQLGLHSLRRGGATAAAASGASMREVMQLGRWRSDAAYLYALASDQAVTTLTANVTRQLAQHLRELSS